jgi:hypothetical protein
MVRVFILYVDVHFNYYDDCHSTLYESVSAICTKHDTILDAYFSSGVADRFIYIICPNSHILEIRRSD